MRIWRVLAVLIGVAATLAAFQWTNEKKSKPRDRSIRTITGVVQMPDESPAVGAVVQIKNLKTLQVKSFITQTDGKYIFQNLSASTDYELRAQYKDMASAKRSLSIYDTRLDPVMNLRLEPGKREPEKEEEPKK